MWIFILLLGLFYTISVDCTDGNKEKRDDAKNLEKQKSDEEDIDVKSQLRDITSKLGGINQTVMDIEGALNN